MITKEIALKPIQSDSDNNLLSDNNIYRPKILRCICGKLPEIEVIGNHEYEAFCCNELSRGKTKFETIYRWNFQVLDNHDNEIYLHSLGLPSLKNEEDQLCELKEFINDKSGGRDFLTKNEMALIKAKILYLEYVIQVQESTQR